MEDSNGSHDLHLASRKAEEAALRRFQAVHWLECFVGPLGLPDRPSEREFVSCLRNGLILCNVINKIRPGSVPKIVERHHLPLESVTWDSKALPAYQYFENVKNFLVAVQEFKIPAFQASDLEREGFEAGSVCRVVDCILALKGHYELSEYYAGSGARTRPPKSPLPLQSGSKNIFQTPNVKHTTPFRRLELSAADGKSSLEDDIAKALVDRMLDTKENINISFLTSIRNRELDPISKFRKILTDCLEENLQIKLPELSVSSENGPREGSCTVARSSSVLKDLSTAASAKKSLHYNSKMGRPVSRRLLRRQEKELLQIKISLSNTKKEFEELNFQFFSDLKSIENLVQEMSAAVNGYQKVVKENRNLYNMVQDLKGNIRVYCKIRPILQSNGKSVIDFIGEDGSLVLVDPSKPHDGGRHVFQFNRVYEPMASQDEVFRDARPLIRSAMDGYNVCIIAYGQTGSGKTYTMSGVSASSVNVKGINYYALNDLFNMSVQRKNIMNYAIHVQMVEIYNEQVRDLLAEDSTPSKLDTVSHANSDEATLHHVRCIEDAINLIKLGEQNRWTTIAANNINNSWSHSILTMHVHGKDKSGSVSRGRLHLVDLAGSERVDSEGFGDGSLSCFQDVITSLAQKSFNIPYRNSKLTLLLQDALGGSGKTLMFAHISPEADDLAETVRTLKFAHRVSTIEFGATSSNKQNGEVMELKQQIEKLKKALVNKEAQNGHSNHRPTSPFGKSNVVYERTPQPRGRRTSLENPSLMKFQRTPNAVESKSKEPRSPTGLAVRGSRRLSIENSRARVKPMDNLEVDKDTRRKSPLNGRKDISQSTSPFSQQQNTENHSCMKTERVVLEKILPPRSRRSSIETPTTIRPVGVQKTPISQRRGTENSCSPTSKKVHKGKISKTPLSKARHGTKRAPVRARRLSLEGSRTNSTNDVHMNAIEAECDSSVHEVASVATSTACVSIADSVSELSHCEAPVLAGFENLQLPKTPDRQVLGRMEAQLNAGNSLPYHQTPSSATSSHVKESQIKKSLRSIFKRNHHHKTGASTKVRHTPKSEMESTVAASSRTSRRQSLTGILPTGPENLRRSSLTGTLPTGPGNLRRSSLEGKSTDTYMGGNRSKTPPPPATKTTKRWM